MEDIARRNFRLETADGLHVAVREVSSTSSDTPPLKPIVLLHGTRIPGASEYDLQVPNGSLAVDLAARGHRAFVLDARGYGNSDRPAAMSRPPSESRPFARSLEITRDIDAAVNEVIRMTGQQTVGLMGWGVGATAILMYAALWPERISHLVLYNVLYGGGSAHARYRGHPLEDPKHPGRFNVAHYGGYAYNDPQMLMDKWDLSIPVEDKDSWRDPEVAAAFRQAVLDGDPTSMTRSPPSYRCPNGMLEDSYFMGKGEKLVHACQVYSKVLIIRPSLDYFSRAEDVAALQADLVNAASVELWEPEGTHYIILDRPERGRDEAVEKIVGFLRQ